MRRKTLIRVSGTVQGVGFRPFIYRTAEGLGINGYVKNLGDAGVEITAEGDSEKIERFIRDIREKKPVNAVIERISAEEKRTKETAKQFRIMPSGGKGLGGKVPADCGICDACRKEIMSEGNRRRSYPMVSCTDCGPRYSITEKIPLDRRNTSYRDFTPCDDCKKEYRDPVNRRFHAQTIACPKCGPGYFLLDDRGGRIKNPVENAIEKLKEGKIVAIKGVGGIHLACLATDDKAVKRLRKKRDRPQQPFAVMATLQGAGYFAKISKQERILLESREKPIVVLKKSPDCYLSEFIAPGLANVGVMLPYSGLHHIIFKDMREPLVMTSANMCGEPMITDNKEIFESKAADYYLLHNLEITNRCDDSVIKMVNDRPSFIRRSRGFAPLPVKLDNPKGKNILALGASENVTFCLLKGNDAFQSQHIGRTESLRTAEFLEEAIERFLKLIPAEIDLIACDLHPGFGTGRMAEKLGARYDVPLIKVQHHHAHLASLAGEHQLREMVGICCDGAGYGLDGKVWGGEVFILKDGKVERIGHLKNQPMPGGDLAAYYPARMVAGMLYECLKEKELIGVLEQPYFKHGKKEAKVVLKQLEENVNVRETSSAGRFLDAVSTVLGICGYRSYEGEPAMKLEAAGAGGRDLSLPIDVRNGIVDTSSLLLEVLDAKRKGMKTRDIACSAQAALAKALGGIAVKEVKKTDTLVVGVSGGVAYNTIFTRTLSTLVEDANLRFVQNAQVPCGDGGISYGQTAYARFT